MRLSTCRKSTARRLFDCCESRCDDTGVSRTKALSLRVLLTRTKPHFAFKRGHPAGFAAATSLASYVFGGIGYAFIVAMTATSFDRTASTIGGRAWRVLHLTGGYYLLLQFMVAFGKRIPDMPLYALFLIPLLAVFALRMIAMAPRPRQAMPAG